MLSKYNVDDEVFFKSDIEQYGIIVKIIPDRYNNKIQYEVKPSSGRFYGEYIPRDAKTTTLYESDCYEC
jgi:hypothetical protein